MKIHRFETELVNKQEIFDALALSHATGYPVLIFGVIGTAKTNAVIDYMKGFESQKLFKVEFSESTQVRELTGSLDYKKLITENEEAYITPIADADAILINEIDKGDSGLRNSMLSIMSEKMIFRGTKSYNLKYKLFVGTCNHRSTMEADAAFNDRFLLNVNSQRLPLTDFAENWMLKSREMTYNIPEPSEIDDALNGLSEENMLKFINGYYEICSDRTLFKSKKLIAAASLIWGFTEVKAILKIAKMINKEKCAALEALLGTDQVTTFKQHIDNIATNQDKETAIKKLNIFIKDLVNTGSLSKTDANMVKEYAMKRKNDLTKTIVNI